MLCFSALARKGTLPFEVFYVWPTGYCVSGNVKNVCESSGLTGQMEQAIEHCHITMCSIPFMSLPETSFTGQVFYPPPTLARPFFSQRYYKHNTENEFSFAWNVTSLFWADCSITPLHAPVVLAAYFWWALQYGREALLAALLLKDFNGLFNWCLAKALLCLCWVFINKMKYTVVQHDIVIIMIINTCLPLWQNNVTKVFFRDVIRI